jgi:hypothetical protein
VITDRSALPNGADDGDIGPGSSGSWVVRGISLCGYIVAGDNHSGSAFMVPIEDCFEDLRSLLGAQSISVHDWPTRPPPHSDHIISSPLQRPVDHKASGQPFARMAVPSIELPSTLNRYLDDSDDHFALLGSPTAEGSSSNPPILQNLARFRTSENQESDVEDAQFFAKPKVSDAVCESLAHLTWTSESFGHLAGEGKVIDHSKEDNFWRSAPPYRATFATHSQDNTAAGLLCWLL